MNKKEAYAEGRDHGYEAAIYTDVGVDDTDLETWFERDRAHIELRDKDGDTIIEWWDDDVHAAFEDGFLDPKAFIMGRLHDERRLHNSVYEYAEELGLVPTKEMIEYAAFESEQNARQYSPWEHLAHAINTSHDPEGLWEEYDRGVAVGIRKGAKDRLKELKKRRETIKDPIRRAMMGFGNDKALLDEFEKLLRGHDWYYMMSDDHRWYLAGYRQAEKIRSMVPKIPPKEGAKLWDKYAPIAPHSNRPFTNPFRSRSTHGLGARETLKQRIADSLRRVDDLKLKNYRKDPYCFRAAEVAYVQYHQAKIAYKKRKFVEARTRLDRGDQVLREWCEGRNR